MVAAHEAGRRVVGVVSAMGKTTDQLVALAADVSPRPHPREMDMLLSTGERISAALCAMAIEDLGHRAVSLTGSQAGIVTDTVHTKAKIVEIRPRRIEEALARDEIVLVAGFQGVSTAYDVTTLGRGGSDTTAVALAAALGGDCEIYTDVDGVFSADPRIVPERGQAGRGVGHRDARDGRLRRTGAAAALGRVCPQPRGCDPCTVNVLRRRGNLDSRGRNDGRRHHLRDHPHNRRGLRHAHRRARQARHRREHLQRRRRPLTSTSTRSSKTPSPTATPTSPSRSRPTTCR